MTSTVTSPDSFEHPDFMVIQLHDFLEKKEETAPSQQEASVVKTSLMSKLIPSGLIAMDNLLDLVPLGSTASNAIDLGLKHVVFKNVDPESSFFKDYIKHLNEKQTKTCLAYSLPLAGNVLKLGVIAKKAVIAIGTLDERFFPAQPPKEDVKNQEVIEEIVKVTI